MPYNPNRPINNTTVDADELRENFNGLKELIDDIPAGPPGADGSDGHDGIDGEAGSQGPQGPPGANGGDGPAGVPGPNFSFKGDWVNSVYQPGDVVAYNGSVYVAFDTTWNGGNPDGDGRWRVLTLTVGPQGLPGSTGAAGADGAPGPQGPAGADGINGVDGAPGPQGPPGEAGAQGPQGPAGNDGRYVVGITDLGGGYARIEMSDNSSYGPFIAASGPQGLPGIQGDPGPSGNDGAQGPAGPQGLPGADGTPGDQGLPGSTGPAGEVTNQQLIDAIGGTSNNTNSVSVLNLTVSDPPTQGEMQTIANKMDELINALRR